MMRRLLCLLVIVGCAASRAPAPAAQAPTGDERAVEEGSTGCVRQANVAVVVDNQSSLDVQITFGPYTAARISQGFAQTTYSVPRYYLQSDIRVRIARGGLEVSDPPPIPTEFVVCNDATLVIGPRPAYSFFYGDRIVTRSRPDSGR